jgi:hypothetical protein
MSPEAASPAHFPDVVGRRRALLVDILGLLALLGLLLDYLRPAVLLLPTIAAGGDTPCHYPTAAWFHERLLPGLRFHGWYPGAYLGHPLLLYYFPLPFLVISALTPFFGLPAAFKLGSVGGVFLLPLFCYAAFRLLRFRFPGPLLAAAASVVFLFVEDNPIWGGTIASTLAGEFAYTYGIGLAVLFLGLVYRCYTTGASPARPAVLLALVALAHGYGVLWAGLSAAYFLYGSRKPGWTLGWLARVAAGAFCLAGFWLLPLLVDWRWTTPYDDPWITVAWRNIFPPLLWPLMAAAALGLVATALMVRRGAGPDHRLLFLGHAALVSAALAAAGPALGIVDVRFVPFGQLALALMGAAFLGLLLQGLRFADLAALGLVLGAVTGSAASSKVLRFWGEWNHGGLEAKELWPAWQDLNELLRGTAADPRVAIEYSQEHEKAGSIRLYETLPHFSGRSTLEGVYNQASLMTHAVYYVASELGASSPNPFRRREYSRFDTDAALAHLKLFNVREVVALSAALTAALDSHPGVRRVASIPPYTVFRLLDPGPGYAEAMTFAPVRASWRDWREKSYRWITRKAAAQPHLVFSDDPRFDVVEKDEWLAPPAVALPGGAEVTARLEPEAITLRTSRVGHPVLVKVAWHPRWRAEGADVRLVYGRRASDFVGAALTLAAVAALVVARVRPRRPVPAAPEPMVPADTCDVPVPARARWGAAIPGGLLAVLFLARLWPEGAPAGATEALYDRASRAFAEGRFADAAEYARNALFASQGGPLHAGLQNLRGESLLRAGRHREALQTFQDVIGEGEETPYLAEALFGAAEAQHGLGDVAGAAASRARLVREFPDSPWTARLRQEGATAEAVSAPTASGPGQ